MGSFNFQRLFSLRRDFKNQGTSADFFFFSSGQEAGDKYVSEAFSRDKKKPIHTQLCGESSTARHIRFLCFGLERFQHNCTTANH